MTNSKIMNLDEVLFLDTETVETNIICQIGISVYSKKSNSIQLLFCETVNPNVSSKQYNQFHMNKHKVSIYDIKNAKKFSEIYETLHSLLNNKTVLHFGGSDLHSLNHTLKLNGLPELNFEAIDLRSVTASNGSLAQSSGIESPAYHCAGFDSYMTAFVFAKSAYNYQITANDKKFIQEMNEKYKGSDEEFRVRDIKNGNGMSVCLTGFKTTEKKQFAEKITSKGFKIVASVVKDLNYLVTPADDYQKSTTKIEEAKKVNAKIMTLDDFLKMAG